jgi:hypothetical protein
MAASASSRNGIATAASVSTPIFCPRLTSARPSVRIA